MGKIDRRKIETLNIFEEKADKFNDFNMFKYFFFIILSDQKATKVQKENNTFVKKMKLTFVHKKSKFIFNYI